MSDTTEYPKTYRPALRLRLVLVIVAIALCGMGAMVAAAGRAGGTAHLAGGLLAAVGLLLAGTMLRSKTTLHEDRIAQTSVFGVRELRREEIQGYRVRQGKNSAYFELLPVHEQLKKMSVEKSVFQDGVFTDWARNIGNLDEIDQRAVDLAVAQDESLGTTPEQRKARVQMQKKFSLYLGMGYLLAASVLSVYPHPEWLAVTVIFAGPWIAIAMVLLSKQNFTIVETEKRIMLRKGSLLQMLLIPLIPIFVLLTSAMDDSFRFPLDWHALLLPSLAGGAAMTMMIWLVSRSGKVHVPLLLSMSLPMILYAGGVTALLNSAFDRQDTRNFALTVLDKHHTTGKGAADFFTVASSDPAYIGQTSIEVPYKLYAATQIGGTVCAQIHPGLFGMRWETIGGC